MLAYARQCGQESAQALRERQRLARVLRRKLEQHRSKLGAKARGGGADHGLCRVAGVQKARVAVALFFAVTRVLRKA